MRRPSDSVVEITEKINGISIGSSDFPTLVPSRPSVASSRSNPASDLVIRRSEHDRFHPPSSRPPQSTGSDSGSPPPSKEQQDFIRMKSVGRKKDFKHMERVNGRLINVLEGLELHTDVFNSEEQKKIVDFVYDSQDKGRKGQLRERTYTEPRKWMRGKGRVTIQFGCCYNYAVDKHGNPPGIIRDEEVDPLPPLLKSMIKRMVAWHVLPTTCVPNSCIINIYEEGDCIPPHVDHHDFIRPFCTVSFLTKSEILFGTEIKVLGPGGFSGSVAIPLPVGSILILKGNGADIAKHCVPAVREKRISITFRRMDQSKIPYTFRPDPELENLRPLQYRPPPIGSPVEPQVQHAPLPQVSRDPDSGDSKGRSWVSPQVHRNSDPRPPTGHSSVSPQVHQNSDPRSSTRHSWISPQLHHDDQNSGSSKDHSGGSKEKSGNGFNFAQVDFPPLGSDSGGVSRNRSNRLIRQ